MQNTHLNLHKMRLFANVNIMQKHCNNNGAHKEIMPFPLRMSHVWPAFNDSISVKPASDRVKEKY